MNLNDKVAEAYLEEIRMHLSRMFNQEQTTEEALRLVIESFYSRYFYDIKEINKQFVVRND
ncbi:hypothetical protein ACNQFZ_06680 [Schinkia sp. CFF1]